ncbi:zinc finger protein ZFP2-like [Galleria mellonella]|uniref:Zinc finger protein ZFP2-like n=1 Tax=Galleria mellonella TaxID=7137 RepID=A0ABM3MAP0_GALME|nr:zinc finger protein ZFP2-like [Galleria mellonella]
MEDIEACRVCLSTDTKLFNMFENLLVAAYENVSGLKMSSTDGLPQYTCSYCSTMLLKYNSFRANCQKANKLLKLLSNQDEVTTDRIRCLDLNKYKLVTSYTKTAPETIDYVDIIVKEEVNDSEIDFVNEVEIEYKEEPYYEKSVEGDAKSDLKADGDLVENVFINVTYGDDIDVIFLTKEQQIEEVQSRKSSSNYIKSSYKCDLCFKGFMVETTYRNHMIRHHPSSGSFECDICLTRWPNLRTLRGHSKQSHQIKYVCKLCNYVSNTAYKAKEHSNWHKGHHYECKVCGAKFSKSTSHLTHVRLQHPSEHVCDICGESFIGENGLRMHHKKSHRDVKCLTDEAAVCALCGVQFVSVEALNRHTDVTENGICDPNLMPCTQCGVNFESDDALLEHVGEMHSKEDHTKCEPCNRTFVNERSYALHHQRVHLGIKSKPASSKAYDNPAVCEVCGKECTSKSTLMYHQRIHTGEKPYECSHCFKRFSVQQRLQIHIRTHTNERPYQCAVCPKAFKHKAALNRHNRVHTGDKPYQCQHCGKSFSQSNSMKVHVKTVHLKLPAPYRSRRRM